MKQTKSKNPNKYQCILAFNDSEECYLMPSVTSAKKEAMDTLNQNDNRNTNLKAYILEFKTISELALMKKITERRIK